MVSRERNVHWRNMTKASGEFGAGHTTEVQHSNRLGGHDQSMSSVVHNAR